MRSMRGEVYGKGPALADYCLHPLNRLIADDTSAVPCKAEDRVEVRIKKENAAVRALQNNKCSVAVTSSWWREYAAVMAVLWPLV